MSRRENQMDIIKATKFIHYKIEGAITSMLHEKNLTGSQSYVLMCIMESGYMYSSDIHKRLNISRPTVSGLMKKLRAKGYIRFEGCDSDERQKKIVVTEKAVKHKSDINSTMKKIEKTVFSGFTDQEIELLHTLIGKMAENTNNIPKEVSSKYETDTGTGQAV
ncbi:MAG: MarR family transcriptional regulator [Ruminococcus sp.]|nr:MarR family transcriptional regulator [Ruminococcus sp.]